MNEIKYLLIDDDSVIAYGTLSDIKDELAELLESGSMSESDVEDLTLAKQCKNFEIEVSQSVTVGIYIG